jgi:hypothetical protein
MPDYSLFGFSRVKNIWVKVAPGGVRNNGISNQNLQLIRAACQEKNLPPSPYKGLIYLASWPRVFPRRIL